MIGKIFDKFPDKTPDRFTDKWWKRLILVCLYPIYAILVILIVFLCLIAAFLAPGFLWFGGVFRYIFTGKKDWIDKGSKMWDNF